MLVFLSFIGAARRSLTQYPPVLSLPARIGSSTLRVIGIRDVPDQLHSTLKLRAAREGMSLSDYLKRELERTAAQPSLRERVQQVKPIPSTKSSAEIVRELRER